MASTGCNAGQQAAGKAPRSPLREKREQMYKKIPPSLRCPHFSAIIRDATWRVWRWDFLAEVRVQEGEPLENALRRFKRKVQQEDIIKEVKRHSYYLKPGEKKRVKAALARKRNRKKARKEQD
jgi:small subunit ribosomal protein S21